jgi:hypothetical protein
MLCGTRAQKFSSGQRVTSRNPNEGKETYTDISWTSHPAQRMLETHFGENRPIRELDEDFLP